MWSIAQRLDHEVTEAQLRRAFDDGELLRTHVLRPTWHLVAPEDLRLLQAATGPRVHAVNAYWYRQLELDDRTRGRARECIVDALTGGNFLTRAQLGERLKDVGITATGQRLAYVLMDAELDAVVCSGPLLGRTHTYALVEERVADATRWDHDEALVEVVRRYLAVYGPATRDDLRNWASLRVRDVQPAFNALRGELDHEERGGRTYWWLPPLDPPGTPASPVQLLQPYDAYLSGYLESRDVADLARRTSTLHPDEQPGFPVLIRSQLAGHWRRRIGKDLVEFDMILHDHMEDEVERCLQRAAAAHARFLERTEHLRIGSVGGLSHREPSEPQGDR